jgi:oligoribonuclease
MIGWIDIETTGLDPKTNTLLEVVLIVTDDDLNVLRGSSVVIAPPLDIVWDRQYLDMEVVHTENGLLTEARQHGHTLSDAAQILCDVLGTARDARDTGTPMGGSSVWFDRMFLKAYMPSFERAFHYRNIDVSTVAEMARRWRPDLYARVEQEWPAGNKHRAESDLDRTLGIARFYRKELFVGGENGVDLRR